MSTNIDCNLCPPNKNKSVSKHDGVILCDGHWKMWLDRYLNSNDQPCPAHLTRKEHP